MRAGSLSLVVTDDTNRVGEEGSALVIAVLLVCPMLTVLSMSSMSLCVFSCAADVKQVWIEIQTILNFCCLQLRKGYSARHKWTRQHGDGSGSRLSTAHGFCRL